MTRLQSDQVGGVEEAGRRPGDRPEEPRERVDLLAQPSPPVPPHGGSQTATGTCLGEDAIECREVAFAGADSPCLGVEEPLQRDAETADFHMGTGVERTALEKLLGVAGEVDKVEAEDTSSGGHVITIRQFGDYRNATRRDYPCCTMASAERNSGLSI